MQTPIETGPLPRLEKFAKELHKHQAFVSALGMAYGGENSDFEDALWRFNRDLDEALKLARKADKP